MNSQPYSPERRHLRKSGIHAESSGAEQRKLISSRLWNSQWTRIALMGLVVTGSSCSSASQYVQRTFQKSPSVTADSQEQEGKVKHAYTASQPGTAKVETLAQSQVAQNPEQTAMASGKAEQQKAPASADVRSLISKGEDPFAGSESPIQQTSNSEFEFSQDVVAAIQGDTISHEADPRVNEGVRTASSFENCPPAISSPSTAPCPPTVPCGARPFPTMGPNKDEFVCDGGDRGLPVHYEGRNRAGLDTEDTIAEFRDETGKVRLMPSTQACVYAPRFGSVSSATLPEEGLQVEKAAGHQDQAAAVGMQTKTVIDEKRQTDEVQAMLTRSRASGVEGKQVEDHIHLAQQSASHVKLVGPHEDFRFIREGQFDRVNTSVLTLGVNAAQEWADGRRPIIVAKDAAGQLVQGRFTAQEFVGVEDQRTPAELKLIKVADKSSAHPGDIVTFTIRFDNTGGRDLSFLRVVDNLSPRLEYIENSINSDRDGTVNVEENGFGGKLLTFEFEEPLKGNTGGFVSFQCRVR